MLTFLQWWCEHDPDTGKKRVQPKNSKLSDEGAAADAARFLQWYIKQGHQGYKVCVCTQLNWVGSAVMHPCQLSIASSMQSNSHGCIIC
jgi:hypothetical protein